MKEIDSNNFPYYNKITLVLGTQNFILGTKITIKVELLPYQFIFLFAEHSVSNLLLTATIVTRN